jgi:hypothetical protein
MPYLLFIACGLPHIAIWACIGSEVGKAARQRSGVVITGERFVTTKIEPMELSDPLSVPDTFVEGIGEITKVGGCVRYTLYAIHHGERIVVARLVWPAALIAEIANAQARAFFESGFLLN